MTFHGSLLVFITAGFPIACDVMGSRKGDTKKNGGFPKGYPGIPVDRKIIQSRP